MISTSLIKKENLTRVFLSLLMTLLMILTVEAQSLSDIQNLQVDDLSDAQIEQLIQRAQSEGISANRIDALARERGMSATEAAKLRERIDNLLSGGGQNGGQLNDFRGRSLDGVQQDVIFDSLRKTDPYYELTPYQKKIFGFRLFHNRQLDFSPSLNLPTPGSYVIGGGDQLLIDIYGAAQLSYDLSVNPEGTVFIPNIGPVQLGGSTIEAARSRLQEKLSRIISGLGGPNPSSFLEIRLGNIRSIKVSMVGELSNPGTYTLPSFATAFNALYAAGGPNENGAFRNIQIYRDSKLVATVDIYEFLSKGNQSANINLQDNDVIIVPPIESRVEIIGPVRREGLFEVKAGEKLSDLYIYTGGFTSLAYRDRVTIRRVENNERKVIDVPSSEFDKIMLVDGDEILIGEALDRFSNRVQISGSVFRPGEYSIEDGGLTIKGLVSKAEGLRPEAFTNRATLYRTSEDLTLDALSVDLEGIINGSSEDIPLKNEDLLFVPSRYDIQEEYYVKISGEVNTPGTYPFASNMTVGDLILRSGGLLESATSSSIEVARRIRDASTGKIAEIQTLSIDPDLNISEEEAQLPLQPFDHVFIRRSPGFEREQLITIRGEVIYPGDFAISSSNERISDVIKRAGGLNQFAYPKGASLIRRTVYYKEKTEEQRKEELLKEIQQNLDPDLTRPSNEAEMILFDRIDKKLTQRELERLLQEQEDARNLLFQNLSVLDSLSADSTLVRMRMNEQDFVGIDLEAIMANPGSEEDLILMEGDIIQVPKELQTVRMVGEVLLPTTTRYVKNQGLKRYISKAGGFAEKARRSKTYVVYANGDARRTHSFLGLKFYPKLEPGAEIIVPVKPERNGLSAAGWIGLASSLATLGVLVQSLIE